MLLPLPISSLYINYAPRFAITLRLVDKYSEVRNRTRMGNLSWQLRRIKVIKLILKI
jgi:hypothetical protein